MAGESAREVARRKRERAERLNRDAERYERGALGEEETARALTMLPASDWFVLHDVHWPGRRFANIDHVVVGPGGLFVIDSKAWQGRVDVHDDVLRQNGRQREDAVAGVADAAIAVWELVPGLHPDCVKPVLCFIGDNDLHGWARDVMVCSSSNLVGMLLSRPVVLDRTGVRNTHGWLYRSLTSAAADVAPRGRASVAVRRARSTRRTPPSRSRTRNRSSLSRGLLGLALIVAVLVGLGKGLPLLSGAITRGTHLGVAPPATSQVDLGAAQSLGPGTGRPPLRVRAGSIVTTSQRGNAVYVAPGNRLVAVRLVIRNMGRRTWVSEPGTTATLTDALGIPHQSAGAVVTPAGMVFPDVIRLRAGRTVRGVVVFQLSRDIAATGFSLTVGPGMPASVAWAIDHQ